MGGRVGEGGGEGREQGFYGYVGVALAFDDDVVWVDVNGRVI
jgi:predicted ATP-grasp superfamily ATP-dependent carboligase